MFGIICSLLEKITLVSKIECDNSQIRAQSNIIQAQMDDEKIHFQELKNEREIYQNSSEYYLAQLKESRSEFQNMLNMYSDVQAEYAQLTNPSLENDNPHAIEIKKLELKIEGLELINQHLNKSVTDSDRVIKAIEHTCIRQISKVEDTIKARIKSLSHKNCQQSISSTIGSNSAESLLVENEQLKQSVEEYAKVMDQMRGEITSLTSSMEESECKMELNLSDERKKEKEFFLKIIKDFEKQRGGNLEDLEKKCAQNVTLRAQIDKLEAENQKLAKVNGIYKTQVDTTNKVMKEQITKKKEMMQENKELKSKLNLLSSRVDQATNEMHTIMADYSVDEKVLENKDLLLQLKGLKSLKDKFDEEKHLLVKENAFLKQSLTALTASQGEERIDLQVLTEEELKEVKDLEIKEIEQLQTLVSNCIDRLLNSSGVKQLFKGSTALDAAKPTSPEEVKEAFQELKTNQNKLYAATGKLQRYKTKFQTIETKFLQEKHELLATLHIKENENKLLKLQIETDKSNVGEAKPAVSEKGLSNKMWAVLKKSKRLHELEQVQNQDKK